MIGTHSRVYQPRHVGTVGQRIEVRLTCERIIRIVGVPQGYWDTGVIYLHICKDAEGNHYLYKGAGKFLKEGQTGTVRATVVSHKEYNGQPQTKINRPTVRLQ